VAPREVSRAALKEVEVVVAGEEDADSTITAEAVAVEAVGVIPADAVPSATIARTIVATAARMIREDKEDRAETEDRVFKQNMAQALMNLPSPCPDPLEQRLMTVPRLSPPMPKGLSKSLARGLASSARRSAPTPPRRTTSSSPPR